MQTFYTLLVHIQVVVMVQIENFKVWKRCEITTKQYKIVCIELAGCMLYGSSPYENTRDQTNKYISIWVNRPTNIFSTQMNGLPYTISRKLFPRGALIFYISNHHLIIGYPIRSSNANSKNGGLKGDMSSKKIWRRLSFLEYELARKTM